MQNSDDDYENMNDDFYDIIAIRFGMKILLGQKAMEMFQLTNLYDQLISRAEFRLMSRLDLGDKWKMYADNAPTLFVLDKYTPISVRLVNRIRKNDE